MEWLLWLVPGGTVAVYLVVCVADARSYAVRMDRQRRRTNGLKLLVATDPRLPSWVESVPRVVAPDHLSGCPAAAAGRSATGGDWAEDGRRLAS